MKLTVNRAATFRLALPLLVLGLITPLNSQSNRQEHSEQTLERGDVANSNIQDALSAHVMSDPAFELKKQQPVEKVRGFDLLIYKDGIKLDWTTGQHARYLMEELRQGIHELQSAVRPQGIDGMALDGARSVWPKLRDIVCGEYPGIRYFDLNGAENFCPEEMKPANTPKR